MTTAAVALLLAAVVASVVAAPIWRRRTGNMSGGGDTAQGQRGGPGPGGPVHTPGPGPISDRRAATKAAVVRVWRHRHAARWGPVGAALVAGCAALPAGPVAAAVLAAYAATGFVLFRGLAVRQSQRRAYRLAADAVVGLAADLRAGLPMARAWRAAEETLRTADASVLPGWRSSRGDRPAIGNSDGVPDVAAASAWTDGRTGAVAVVVHRVVAAAALAQACGAPLADVLDRLDAHLRAVDRARSLASSQAAGARVSAGLLAAMPVAGVGLGTMMGVDAWAVLLNTMAGGLALGLAVALQLGGLAWAARLAAAEVSP